MGRKRKNPIMVVPWLAWTLIGAAVAVPTGVYAWGSWKSAEDIKAIKNYDGLYKSLEDALKAISEGQIRDDFATVMPMAIINPPLSIKAAQVVSAWSYMQAASSATNEELRSKYLQLSKDLLAASKASYEPTDVTSDPQYIKDQLLVITPLLNETYDEILSDSIKIIESESILKHLSFKKQESVLKEQAEFESEAFSLSKIQDEALYKTYMQTTYLPRLAAGLISGKRPVDIPPHIWRMIQIGAYSAVGGVAYLYLRPFIAMIPKRKK